MKYILVIAFCFTTALSKAEVEYSPPIHAYLEADLIVSGKVHIEKEATVITIDEVFRNQTKRQYLPTGKVVFGRDRYGPFSYVAEELPTKNYLLFLKEYKGKMFLYAGSQHIYELEKTNTFPISSADRIFELNYLETKRALSEFQKCFSKQGYSVKAVITPEKYERENNQSQAVLYALQHPFGLLNPYIEEPIEIIEPEPYVTEDTSIYQVVEVMPQFPGGNEALYAFIKKTLIYPVVAKENGITGTVFVQMVLEKNGAITQIEVIRGVEKLLDQEAIRVVRLFPDFIPGLQNGKPVRCFFRLPIRFRLA